MSLVITNPNMKQILEDFDINNENSNLFQHAYRPESSYDPNSCTPYFENGLRLQSGFNSFLATMSPIPSDFASQITEKQSSRGNHKIIICIPHEHEGMYFGTTVNAKGDAGNQYGKHLLIDYLVKDGNTCHLPPEFIMGMYIDGTETTEPCFAINPLFFKDKNNSNQNTVSLKNKLVTMANEQNELVKKLLMFCLGEKDVTEQELQKVYKFLDYLDDNKVKPTYATIKQAVNEKLEKQKTETVQPEPIY